MSGRSPNNAPNDSILEIVWRQRKVVAIAVAAFFLLAVLYLLVATRYYSGYARLFVQQSSTKILNEESRPVQERGASSMR